MPLMDEEPPITFPRGVARRRPPRCGSGSVRVAPVVGAHVHRDRERRRHLDQRPEIGAAIFEHEHAVLAVLGQAVGERAAGRAGADDDVVGLKHRTAPQGFADSALDECVAPSGSGLPSASERRIHSPSISAAAVSAISAARSRVGEAAQRMEEVALQPARIDAQQPPRLRIVLRLHIEGEPGGDDGGAELLGGEVAADDRGEALARRRRLGEARLDLLAELGEEMPHRGEQQLVLAAEIMVRERRRDAGAPGDLAHRHLRPCRGRGWRRSRPRSAPCGAPAPFQFVASNSSSAFEPNDYRFLIDRSIKIRLAQRSPIDVSIDVRISAARIGARGQLETFSGRFRNAGFHEGMRGCRGAGRCVGRRRPRQRRRRAASRCASPTSAGPTSPPRPPLPRQC